MYCEESTNENCLSANYTLHMNCSEPTNEKYMGVYTSLANYTLHMYCSEPTNEKYLGVYTCLANNSLGSSATHTKVKIESIDALKGPWLRNL